MGRVDLGKVNTAVVLEKLRLEPLGMSDNVAIKLLEELASSASVVSTWSFAGAAKLRNGIGLQDYGRSRARRTTSPSTLPAAATPLK